VPLAPGWHRLERVLVTHAAQCYLLPKRAHLVALRKFEQFLAYAFERDAMLEQHY